MHWYWWVLIGVITGIVISIIGKLLWNWLIKNLQ
jgi:hypothetical protein